MQVLITGITGLVGSHLAEYILAEHPEVDVAGIKRWRSPMDHIRHITDQVSLHDCDLRDLSSMLTVVSKGKPDVIFHLAAQSYVSTSYTAPGGTLDTNINGTDEAIREYYVGQHFQFGDTEEHPADNLVMATAVEFLD